MVSTMTAQPAATLGYDALRRLIGLQSGDEKHLDSAHSTLDVLWVLYDRVLRVSLASVADPERDRLLVSKGHGPMAYYAVLAAKGFFPIDWLSTYGRFDSALGMHPDATRIPGVEIGSGSLGHGLPIAVGLTLGLRAQGRHDPRVFVLIGDGELDEGSNAEAIAFAGRAGLDRLTVIAVDNYSSRHGWPGGISARFALEGWATRTVDGRDHAVLEASLATVDPDGRPLAVVATVERKA